ncbi:MAG TPA: TlpA disulfide reductase family protein [Nitrospirota bacterium]|nr:TlpA disulfide reductase family protein [Nitrospirota bacterium]
MRFPYLPLLFLSLTAFIAVSAAAEPQIGIEPGNRAPAIELQDLNGRNVTLADFRGKIVLLNFWSTLCAPCVAEMPSLNKLHTSLSSRGFSVLSISIDKSGKPVKTFTSDNKIIFPVLLDSEKAVFFDDFAAPSLPASYLIDRDGIILESFSGPREWDSPESIKKITKLLDKR